MVKQTVLFRILKRLKITSNQEAFGTVNILGLIKYTFSTLLKLCLFKYCYSSFILEPINLRFLRAKLWKLMGVNMGKNVLIGHSVSLDYGNTKLIYIEDNVIITNKCILLCHKRDLSTYTVGDKAIELPYHYKKIVLKRGCQVGMGTIIMPGATIGEGAIVGAMSVVTKDIPPWSIAIGNPAKVIKKVKEKQK